MRKNPFHPFSPLYPPSPAVWAYLHRDKFFPVEVEEQPEAHVVYISLDEDDEEDEDEC